MINDFNHLQRKLQLMGRYHYEITQHGKYIERIVLLDFIHRLVSQKSDFLVYIFYSSVCVSMYRRVDVCSDLFIN
jgi:hypothetical protein